MSSTDVQAGRFGKRLDCSLEHVVVEVDIPLTLDNQIFALTGRLKECGLEAESVFPVVGVIHGKALTSDIDKMKAVEGVVGVHVEETPKRTSRAAQ